MEGMSATTEKNRLPIYESCTTCIINLERRPDRLKLFEDRYTKTWNEYKKQHVPGMNKTIIRKAVDGKKLDDYVSFKEVFNSCVPLSCTRGEIGCFLSHYEIFSGESVSLT